jgi:hypothetical protein
MMQHIAVFLSTTTIGQHVAIAASVAAMCVLTRRPI